MEKHIFDPLLTHFWSQNNPFSRDFVTLVSRLIFEKKQHVIYPFLTDFVSQKGPFSRASCESGVAKWLAMGSKRAHFSCLCTTNRRAAFLENHIFDPFLTHFWSQNNPF